MSGPDDGYATPAAAVISLAIALVVTAVTARSLAELKLARAALARTQADYGLSAAANAALVAVLAITQPPPYRWSETVGGRSYRVIAEPERAKLSPAAMAALEDSSYSALGVGDAEPVRGRLKGLTLDRRLTWIADQAGAPLWRECAASIVSPYGSAPRLQPLVYHQPGGGTAAGLHAGEVWRIRATDPDGWRDERYVQFTGDPRSPAAVIDRRLDRTSKGQLACEELFPAPSDD